MAGLKPIGSEKLEGMEKLQRIMQIARYNENIPQRVNETTSSEYSIELADGNTYEIVKEKTGYIIKQTINESSEYMNPIQERKYYSSYSQALKRLNLMAKEINTLVENDEEIPLIGEQKKKYILKRTKKKVEDTTTPVEPISAPAPVEVAPSPAPVDAAPAPVDAAPEPIDAAPSPVDAAPEPIDSDTSLPSSVDAGSESSFNMNAEMGGDMPDDLGDESNMGDEMPDDLGSEEEVDVEVTDKEAPKGASEYKRIQILVGKLAQKIRSYEESEELSAKDVKYIINSILSAIDVDVLDEDDIEQIISKLEGDEDDEENVGLSDDEVMPDEEPEDLDGEMGESYETYGEAFQDSLGGAYTKAMSDDLFEDDDYGIDDTDRIFQKFDQENKKYEKPRSVAAKDMAKDFRDDSETRREFRKSIIPYDTEFQNLDFEDSFNLDDIEDDMPLRRKLKGRPSNSHYHLEHGTYGESVLDKVISKYYVVNENEIRHNFSDKTETEFQMGGVINFLKKNPNSKFLGKSTKGNLIFKNGLKETKITKSGLII